MILTGDALTVLRTLDSGIAQACITSPPYWGLRDYGVDGQLGLEPTPEEYIARLVEIFAEVKRVLRDDGTLWLVMGDSYAKAGESGLGLHGETSTSGAPNPYAPVKKLIPPGLKPKDLCMIPARVALALQQPRHTGPIKDERDRWWLAGLCDGEGCLTILETTSPYGSGNSYPPVLQIRMTDDRPLARCAEITGYGNASPPQEPPSQVGQRPSYQWRLNGRKAADVAAELYPHLLVKQKQAVILWNHQAVRESYTTKKGVRVPTAAVEKQRLCRDLIQRLNAGEDVDPPSWMVKPPRLDSPGWYLRSDCIWAKPNPMPESVTDRPTSSHEHVFLLAKSQRYFYDADAIREEAKPWILERKDEMMAAPKCNRQRVEGKPEQARGKFYAELKGANKRNVWTVATKPYPEAHFAVYPPALIEPCVLAGSADKACEICGAPWERVVEKTGRKVATPDLYGRPRTIELHGNGTASKLAEAHGAPSGFFSNETILVGFQPTCSCDNEGTAQSIILDPFMGSGTTGEVALKHRRKFIGIELNPEYVKLAEKRLREVEVVMF